MLHQPLGAAIGANAVKLGSDDAAGAVKFVTADATAFVEDRLTAKKPRVRYTVAPDPVQTILIGRLPKRWVDSQMAKRLGLKSSS